MGKPALGKGMKDLLVKNFGLSKEKESKVDSVKAQKELDVCIERYQAQGYETDLLKSLSGSSPDKIMKGIESYRASVKSLISAQTQLRSLEGYCDPEEIESIMEVIKDPSRADEVVKKVDDLRKRVQTEIGLRQEKGTAADEGIPETRTEVEEEPTRGEVPEQEVQGLEIDEEALDGLMDDLEDIEDAFLKTGEEDPLIAKIMEWKEMGYFVDNLMNTMAEDRKKAESEVEQFEKDVRKMEEVKKRFGEMDLSAFEEEAQELMMKFQYPHLSGEISNELDQLEMRMREADRLVESVEAETVEESEEVEEKEPVLEKAAEEESPASSKEPSVEESPSEEVVPIRDEGEIAVSDEEMKKKKGGSRKSGEEEKAIVVEKGPGPYSKYSPDELMDLAKEAYKEGRMEEALALFEELLRKDPESSKARFMIRRISQKL